MSKFKVGDRVRLVARWGLHNWIGTVTNPDDGHDLWPVRVRFDKQTETYDWDLKEDEIELV
jgi:hypothetical protein